VGGAKVGEFGVMRYGGGTNQSRSAHEVVGSLQAEVGEMAKGVRSGLNNIVTIYGNGGSGECACVCKAERRAAKSW
jgi:hypothetical protein